MTILLTLQVPLCFHPLQSLPYHRMLLGGLSISISCFFPTSTYTLSSALGAYVHLLMQSDSSILYDLYPVRFLHRGILFPCLREVAALSPTSAPYQAPSPSRLHRRKTPRFRFLFRSGFRYPVPRSWCSSSEWRTTLYL
jgi:hypothetical protein